FSFFPSLSKSKGGSGSGSSRSSSGGVLSASSLSSKLLKSPKEKLQLRGNRPMHPIQQNRVPHGRIMTPSVQVEKIPPKMDGALLKSAVGPVCPAAVSSSVKPGLNCPSIPKPTLPSPGQILNGKGLPAPPTLEKKSEDNSNNRKFLNKRLSEREFDPDIHCGVIDLDTKKPCTRSLTCKTHSLTQRRAVQGRRKRFDVLLAEHKNKTREKESIRHPDSQQPTQPLRDPHPTPPRTSQEPHQNSHGVIPSESKPFVASKPKPHTPSLPRPPGCPAQQGGSAPIDPPPVHESPHPPLPATEPASRLSSEEGEGDDKEESVEKLDCHYSGHHPQPASFCTFGSRQIGRGYYVFDSRWNRLRCALNLMVEKHLNAQLWKKIPPVPGAASPVSTRVPHRMNSVPTAHCGVSHLAAATVSPSPVPLSSSCISPSSKSVPAHGTTLNAQPAASGAVDPVCSMQSRQLSSSSSSPSTPSGLSSVPSSPMARKPQKLKSSKSLRPKESSGNSTNCHHASSSAGSGGSGKKRKNTSPLTGKQLPPASGRTGPGSPMGRPVAPPVRSSVSSETCVVGLVLSHLVISFSRIPPVLAYKQQFQRFLIHMNPGRDVPLPRDAHASVTERAVFTQTPLRTLLPASARRRGRGRLTTWNTFKETASVNRAKRQTSKGTSLTAENSTGRNNLDTFDDKFREWNMDVSERHRDKRACVFAQPFAKNANANNFDNGKPNSGDGEKEVCQQREVDRLRNTFCLYCLMAYGQFSLETSLTGNNLDLDSRRLSQFTEWGLAVLDASLWEVTSRKAGPYPQPPSRHHRALPYIKPKVLAFRPSNKCGRQNGQDFTNLKPMLHGPEREGSRRRNPGEESIVVKREGEADNWNRY
ncbi:hypothetical protein E2I00_009537, partial [Balaenoptera physalus]